MRWLYALVAVTGWASTATALFLCGSPGANLSELSSSLSSNAAIYLPGSGQFDDLSQRWSELETPEVNITVAVATENDVVETVKWANKYWIPFLVFNGVHGSITTLGRMNCGINIAIRNLSGVTVAANGQTATILGGTNSKVVTDALWATDKQTVTGTCECVSYLGPALGGGHGWLQGRYGLIADQFVSMNIVLADGTLKTINSNSDLWWAAKGAGHNFGIVTSVTVKIYPAQHKQWAIETITFSGDKVEAVYQAANDLLDNGNQPVDVISWSYWFNAPPLDPTGPVIQMYIIQENVTAVDPKYTQPFHAIGTIDIQPQSGDYRDMAGWVGINLAAPPCQNAGLANPRFPAYLPRYNITAQRQAYDLFAAGTNASSPFHNSLFMFEAYSMQGVRAINSTSTAFAFRDDNLVVAPLLQYTPAGPALDVAAKQLGNQIREVLYKGAGQSRPHAYVNYAYGDETAKGWYGSETWRQAKLKWLKLKYDPWGKFSFYGPIPLW